MRNVAGKGLLTVLAGLIVATALLFVPAQSHAYSTLGGKWSKGKISYYNGVKAYDPAVKAAVKAWNNSGAKVKFQRVSKKKARVRIRYMRDNTCRGLTRLPRTRRTTSATVYLPAPGAPEHCRDPFTMTIVAAHELGHVLGLGHEDRRCALQNSVGSRAGGELCAEAGGTPPWLWRCRILEPDDVRGAIKLYGGKYRASKFRTSPLCALYPEPPPAAIVNAVDSGAGNGITVTLQRPADGVVPSYILSQFRGGAPFVYVAYAAGACPPITAAVAYSWGAIGIGQTGTRTVGASLLPGNYCVSAWAADAIGRPSVAATFTPVTIT